MIVILFGHHGSGKGTQAKMIADEYGLARIATGEIFRERMGENSELGKKVTKYLEGNVYVPDELVNEIVEAKIMENKENGFVFDGYPRTLEQAKFLEKTLKHVKLSVDVVINVNINEDKSVIRLANRLVCSNCGTAYNLVTNPPQNDKICDICGSKLYQRKDDTKQGIKSRMKEFEAKSLPLIEYYRKQGKLVDVDGNKSPEQVFKDIKKLLDKLV